MSSETDNPLTDLELAGKWISEADAVAVPKKIPRHFSHFRIIGTSGSADYLKEDPRMNQRFWPPLTHSTGENTSKTPQDEDP